MKILVWCLSPVAAFAALTLFGSTTLLPGAEEKSGGPVDRLERLERRVNEMAQQQQQLLRRLGAQQERQAPRDSIGRDNLRPMKPVRDRSGIGQPRQGDRPSASVAAPAPAYPPLAAGKACKDIAGLVKLCLLVGFIFNILLAIWIFTDIRKRGEGSGIFIGLALLAGIPAAIIYSLVRISDKKP
ncbi:MAG TPA: hypothetical protein P5205_18365 [Candidatus Paceibacterota bacterium]|nr:hypothetical protein [Verrucomicrobiota bacterium]HSA12327.1 hypothetical protein [Candidatus Paceibacterota bacterium]